MKIAVTGSHGYIGREICFLLKIRGHDIHEYDLSNNRDIRRGMGHYDVVVHLAAKKFGKDVIKYNTELTEIVLEHTDKIVFASTSLVYGETEERAYEHTKPKPISDYAKSKLECEKVVINSEKDHSILRFSNIYSLHDTDGLVGKIKSSKIIFGDGNKMRDFVRLEDVIPILYDATVTSNLNNLYNICTGESISIYDLYTKFHVGTPEYVDAMNDEAIINRVSNAKVKNNGYRFVSL